MPRISIVITTLLCLATSASAQTGITFTFANGQITGVSPRYYEFDVMVQASEAGTKFGDGLVYINYNTTGFGEELSGNPPTKCADILDDDGETVIGKSCPRLEVRAGDLITEKLAPGAPYYTIVNVVDNKTDRVAVTVERAISETFSTELPTTPISLLHYKSMIVDSTVTANLTFEQPLMQGQQFLTDQMTLYSPVVATDTDNAALSVSTVATEDSDELPTTIALRQNYPNPFNPSTTISYDLSTSRHVRLTVVDILGKQVRTLVDTEQPAGTYEVRFDATDLATGLYLYRLDTGDTVLRRTMVLIR